MIDISYFEGIRREIVQADFFGLRKIKRRLLRSIATCERDAADRVLGEMVVEICPSPAIAYDEYRELLSLCIKRMIELSYSENIA